MYKNRVKKLIHVKASELRENPDNIRLHPEEQQNIMTGLLEEIGFADAIIVREVEEGYEILDGHMRKRLVGDDVVPVVVVDLNEEEAAGFLLTFDPIKALAERNTERVNTLVERAFANTGAVREMLDKMAANRSEGALMPQGANKSRARVEILGAGKYRVPLSNVECAQLMLIARRYADQTGSYHRFIESLLKKVREHRAAHGVSPGGVEGSGIQPTEN